MRVDRRCHRYEPVVTTDVEVVPVAPTQHEGNTSSAGMPELWEAWGRVMDTGAAHGTGEVIGAMRGVAEVDEAANDGAMRGRVV
jgi:hypothetical protein